MLNIPPSPFFLLVLKFDTIETLADKTKSHPGPLEYCLGRDVGIIKLLDKITIDTLLS